MRFEATDLPGVWIVETEPRSDPRGGFARLFDADAFSAAGLETAWDHCALSSNARRGTVRGFHWQPPPYGQCKLLACLRGAIHDVVLDLRPESPTYLRSLALELSRENLLALYLPEGVGQGFQTLEDDTDVIYFISAAYDPVHERGVRWDDPRFGVRWPLPVESLSARDRSFPDFAD